MKNSPQAQGTPIELADDSGFFTSPEEKPKFTCVICKKSFSDKNCLRKHIQKIHEVEPGPLLGNDQEVKNKAAPFKCRVCETEFAYKRNLKRHSIKYHSQGLEDEEGGNCFCNVEGCRFRSFFISALRTHLADEHKLQIDIENRKFSSKKEFDDWKEQEEKTNVCLFIKEAGKHKLINGDLRLIYQCHRSGHYSGHGFGKRSFRVKGTCKLGKRCTAGIELTVKERGDVHEVVYYRTHIWHEADVIHVNLSASERAYLANKLREGASIASILQSVKANEDEEGVNFCKRIKLLKRKDLVNIENTFRLNNTERHIRKQHKKGQKIAHERIKKNVDSYGEVISWVIEPTSNDSEYFTVKKLLSEKCVEQCGAVCTFCNSCLHMYSCTCHEYLLFGTMCQHIHSVSLYLFPPQKYKKKETLKSFAKRVTDEGKCKKADCNSPRSDPTPTKGNSLATETVPKKTEVADYLIQNFDPQQCEKRLQEGRFRLKKKLNIFSEICLTKIDQIEEETVHLLTKIVDSALQVISPSEMSNESIIPLLDDPIRTTMTITAQPEISSNVFQHVHQPTMMPAVPNDFVLPSNVADTILNNELETMKQDSTLSTTNILPQYYTMSTVRRKRKTEDVTTSTFHRAHVFDKRTFYDSTNSLPNNNSMAEDNYTTFDYNAMSWQTPPLSANNNNNVSLPGKWWNTEN